MLTRLSVSLDCLVLPSHNNVVYLQSKQHYYEKKIVNSKKES